MPIETTTFERAIHLLLFIAGGIAFAVGGLSALERLAGAERPVIRPIHFGAALALFIALGLVELLFHALH